MSLLSKTLPGFFNGVSQQPATNRQDTQCELQENGYGTLVDGLMKRGGTERMATLSSQVGNTVYQHRINRDVTERYLVYFTGDATEPIEVFQLDGTKCLVKYGTINGDLSISIDNTLKSYVTLTGGQEANTSFKALTIADYTFVLNKNVTTAMESATVPGTIQGEKQIFPDLGDVTPSVGDIWEIAGDDTTIFDNYFMKWDGNVWAECAKPGVLYQMDPDSMPHVLIRHPQLDGGLIQFVFGQNEWAEREAGDDLSVMIPSFIDKPIRNLLFLKNRLGFLAGDNIILSRTDKHFNFWRQSALDILDDDPIDTSATAMQVETLRSSAIFDKSLLLFADQQQFDFGSGDADLTPTTAAVTPTTRFRIDPNAEPITAGANVYFVCPGDQYAAIREYFIQPDSLMNDAADITAHVPRYIPQGHIEIETINSMDVLFLKTDAELDSIYVYKYYWMGSEKPQSSWSKWTFNGDVLAMSTIDTYLYLLIRRDSELSLERIQMENGVTGTLPFRVHLDRMVELSGVYDAGANQTTFTLPYTPQGEMVMVGSVTGIRATGFTVDGSTVTIAGNYSNAPWYFGENYTLRYRLSEWYLKNSQGMPITNGRLQIRTLTLSFTDTGYFRVEITPHMRDTLVHEYTGAFIGLSALGEAPLQSGERSFMVMAKSKQTTVDIVNDTYLPSNFQTGAWEGKFHSRARSI